MSSNTTGTSTPIAIAVALSTTATIALVLTLLERKLLVLAPEKAKDNEARSSDAKNVTVSAQTSPRLLHRPFTPTAAGIAMSSPGPPPDRALPPTPLRADHVVEAAGRSVPSPSPSPAPAPAPAPAPTPTRPEPVRRGIFSDYLQQEGALERLVGPCR
ncbi:hypothetical protein GQ602_004950 [Ophiocordyceps camponoti-floridani]|uniref:Uncharacterized protein n=1 Tax=Ophiocordyceps camponoti-floridani TaxID=2030778 RepID=A0A8H4VCI5_9HYPO|nr:hypothetical protein GQ602_004950 [Ophiocordyceps camponoti-floridani]